MTYFDALQTIAANLPETFYDKTGVNILSDEQKEEVNALLDKLIAREAKVINQRAENKLFHASERSDMVNRIRPQIFEQLADGPRTAKEIVVEGFTAAQIQYILLHDLADEIEVIDNGRNAKTYRVKEGA